MTIKNCSLDFVDSLKDYMSKDDAVKLYKRLQATSKMKQERLQQSKIAAVTSTQAEFDKFLDRVKYQQKKQLITNLSAYNMQLERITNFKDPIKGLSSILTGTVRQVKGGRRSTQATLDAELAKALGGLKKRLRKAELLYVYTNEDNGLELSKAMAGEQVENQDIAQTGNILRDYLDEWRVKLNSLGADIGSLDGFITSQISKPEKLKRTADTFSERFNDRVDGLKENKSDFKASKKELYEKAYIRWRDYIMPRLDTARTFADVEEKDIDKFMRSVYNKLIFKRTLPAVESVSEGAQKTVREKLNELFTYPGSKNLAKSLSKSRVLHLKDGQSFWEYNNEYGSGSLQVSIKNMLNNSANAAAMMKEWGTNPRANYDKLSQIVFTKAAKTGQYDRSFLSRKEKELSSIFDMLQGIPDQPASYLGAEIGANIRTAQNLAKMGTVVVSSLPDLPLSAEVMRENGISLFDAYVKALGNLFAGRPKGEQQELADMLSVWADQEIGEIANRAQPWGMQDGFRGKLNGLFFKLTGLPWWDEVNRTGLAASLSRNLAQISRNKFSALDLPMRSLLETYGIGGKEWDLARKSENLYRQSDGKEFVTPDAALSYSEESVAEYLDKDVEDMTAGEYERTKEDLYDNWLNYFIGQVNNANIRPDNYDKFLATRGTKAGSLWGEVARFVSQYKLYSLAFARKVVGRKMFGLENGLVDEAAPDVMGLVNVLVGTTILGYISLNAKNILKGRSMIAPDSFGALTAAMMQGGGLGIFGDFLLGQYDRFGHGLLQDLEGPAITSMNDLATIIFRMKSLEDPTNMMFSFAKNNMPGINLFYIRPFLDYLFLYGLQEKISPGSVRRYQSYLKNNTGQTLYVDPLKYSLV